MKLKQKGRYFELPIIGLTIKKIIFHGNLTLVFNDEEESYLILESVFKVTQFNQSRNLDPRDKEAFEFFYDHYGQTFKEAKADNHGNLLLTFHNGSEIMVEDGPYENWHYTKKNLHVHGGVNGTVF